MTVFIDWPASPSDKVQVGIMDGTPSFAPAPPVGTVANGNCAPTNFVSANGRLGLVTVADSDGRPLRTGR